MSDFTITERTEPFTLDEVFSFIDDTNISKMDACELKSRIVDVVQAERNKVIDEFITFSKNLEYHHNLSSSWYMGFRACISKFKEKAKRMKEGAE